MKLNKNIISGLVFSIAIILSLYSYFNLPETVIVQIDFSGNPSNTEPKIFAIFIPMVLSIGGTLGYYKSGETKPLFISIIGIIIMILTLIFNM